VGGTLAGLTPGESIILVDGNNQTLTLTTNGAFTFTSDPVATSLPWSVAIQTAPTTPIAQGCTITGNSGTMGTAAVTTVTVDCDLLAYLPFNGNANDASGYGNNGVVTNATLTTDVSGNSATGAYAFAGNGNISVTPPSGFFPYGDASRTLTAWLKPTQDTDEWGVVYYGVGNCNAYQFGIGVQGNTNATFWGGCDDDETTLQVPVNSWTFVAIVYSSASPTSFTMYANGTALTGTLGLLLATPETSNLVIGADLVNNVHFTGDIDSVRLYGHALTATEVAAVYAATP
jgi:hypothetical protein